MTDKSKAAFPHVGTYTGMTLREYYAGLAMQALVTNQLYFPEPAAEMAVGYADALLVELNKEKE